MRTIPPAEVFIINKMRSFPDGVPPTPKDVQEWLIEFAKLHVVAALKAAGESLNLNATCDICNNGNEIRIFENAIISSYSLHEIE